MAFARRAIPKRLSSRLWLVTLPSALVSFERRQSVPKLPIGRGRYAGIALIAGGMVLALRAWRDPEAGIGVAGPLAAKPATMGGVLVLGGLALLMRSAVLAAYSLGVAVAASTDKVEVEEPRPSDFIGSVS